MCGCQKDHEYLCGKYQVWYQTTVTPIVKYLLRDKDTDNMPVETAKDYKERFGFKLQAQISNRSL